MAAMTLSSAIPQQQMAAPPPMTAPLLTNNLPATNFSPHQQPQPMMAPATHLQNQQQQQQQQIPNLATQTPQGLPQTMPAPNLPTIMSTSVGTYQPATLVATESLQPFATPPSVLNGYHQQPTPQMNFAAPINNSATVAQQQQQQTPFQTPSQQPPPQQPPPAMQHTPPPPATQPMVTPQPLVPPLSLIHI